MSDWIEISKALAWPLVALVGLIILGPMGLLKDIVKALGLAIGDLSRLVSDFRESTLTLRGDMEKFTAMSTGLSKDFSARINDLQNSLSAAVLQIDKIENSTASILRNAVETEQETLDPNFSPEPDPNETEQTRSLTPDQMYESIRHHWSGMVEMLQTVLDWPDDFDKRRVGEIAIEAADGRRINGVDRPLGEAIAALHSQFKKFVRLSQSKDQWLTHEVYTSFVSKISEVNKSLSQL